MMRPTFVITALICTDASSFTPTTLNVPTTNVESPCGWWDESPAAVKKETKKERTQRIALAKMYDSWNVHNKKQKPLPIKQISKPKHALNYFGGKKFKAK